MADDERLDGGAVARFRGGVAPVMVGDEAVLYEEDTGELHRLNASGTAVCELLDGWRSVDEIIEELAEAFGEERARIRDDVLGLVRDLRARELVVWTGPQRRPGDPGAVTGPT